MNTSVRTTLLVLPLCCSVALGSAMAQATTPSTGTTARTKPNGQSSTGTTATRAGSPSGSAADANEPAPPAHPLSAEQTTEFLRLMGFQKNMDNMLTQTIGMQKQQAPFVPADVWTDFQSSFGKVDYNTLLQPVFAKYLSQEDAAKALEFYRTPAGQHVLQATPMLMRDIAVTSQQNGQQVSRDVIQRHRPEIEAAQKKYQQEHEPPASGGAGAGGAGGASGAGAAGSGGASGAGAGSAPSTATPPASSSPQSSTPNSTANPH